MIDPRELLKKELTKLGISNSRASAIVLDAGSSQCVVNKEYLRKIIIEKDKIEKVYQKVKAFYFGELAG